MKLFNKYIVITLSFVILVACSDSPNPSSSGSADTSRQNPSSGSRGSAVTADNYFDTATDSSTPISTTQYLGDGRKMAPISSCGQNGADLFVEMEQEVNRLKEEEGINYELAVDSDLRIIQQGFAAIPGLEPSADIFIARNEAMNMALLNAKAAVIKTLGQKISASQVLHIPISGLSIDEKVDAQTRAMRQQFASLAAETQELGREYQALTEAVIVADENELRGITTQDRARSLFDAAIKKLDESYDPASVSEEKKARVLELKERLQTKRAEFLTYTNQLQDLERDLQSARNLTTMKTTVEALAQMPIYGLTKILHMECFDAQERSVYLLVRVIWTPRLHEEARSVLLNEPIELPKKEQSMSDYLASLDLSMELGGGRHIDDEGTVWFYSIRSADMSAGDPNRIIGATDLLAQGQVQLLLMSEAMTHQRAEEAVAFSEARRAITAQQFNADLSASARELNLSGIVTMRQTTVKSPITQRPSYVSVAALNMKAAHGAPEAMASLYATLKEVNYDQSYREGLRQGMIDEAESTRNDPGARAQGYSDGGEAVGDVVAENQAAAEGAEEGELVVGKDGAQVAPEAEEQSVKFKSKAKKDDF